MFGMQVNDNNYKKENTNMKITYEESQLIDHFHNDRGDITRWVGWDNFCIKHPEVKAAFDNMENARKIFELVINGLDVEDEL